VPCDVACLQEVKSRPEQAGAAADPLGWQVAWHSAQRPGYSSVACFSRERPDEVRTGLGDERFDCEGRVLSLRFGSLWVINAYFPNAQDFGRRLDYKLAFCAAMEGFLADLRRGGRHTLLVGDYNIAHQPIDLARPRENEQSPGYLPEERAWMTRYLGLGHRDVFRDEHPDLEGAYSWWSYRGGARGRNVGWRIDLTTVDAGLRGRAHDAAIHPEVLGSDHCPVSIEVPA